MSEMTREEATKAIYDLKRASEEQGKALAANDKAIADLKDANKALTEANRQLAERNALPQGGAQHTSDFVVDRASVRDAVCVVRNDGGGGVIRSANGERAIVLRTMKVDGDEIPGLLDSTPTSDADGEWQLEAQRLHDQAVIARACVGNNIPRTMKALRRHWSKAPAAIRAALPDGGVERMFADSSAIGGEFVPDVVSNRMEMTLRAERRVAALFEEIQAPKEWRLPFLTSGLTPYLKGSVTADDPAQYRASALATAQRTFTAKGVAVRTQLDDDMEEDSIIPAQGLLESELVAAQVDGEEDALINGDTAGTHQDSALSSWNPRSRYDSTNLGGADDVRKWFIGLRARAYDVSGTSDKSAANTYAGFMAMKATMASPHGVEGDTVMITSPEQYLYMLGNWTQLITLDLFGPQAAILTGQVAKIGNTPVVVSEFVTADLQTTGLFTSAGGSKTGYLVANRKRFIRTATRGITVERAKDITRGVWHLVTTRRGTFGTFDSSSHKNVVWAFNL